MLLDLSQPFHVIWTQVLRTLDDWGGERMEIWLCECQPDRVDTMIDALRSHPYNNLPWNVQDDSAALAFKRHLDCLVVVTDLAGVPATCVFEWESDPQHFRLEICIWPGDILNVSEPASAGGLPPDVDLAAAESRFATTLCVVRELIQAAGARRVEVGLAGDLPQR